MDINRCIRLLIAVQLASQVFSSCGVRNSREEASRKDSVNRELEYIKPIEGKSDSIAIEDVQRGKVLIAYSDCHTCHHEGHRSKGPAFRDIAKRYPVNDGYIALLARKIVVGGSGAWGSPVMTPHPEIPDEDAKLMAKYILSLRD